MPLPDFHDQRPYIHPDHPGSTWRISIIGPRFIMLRRDGPHAGVVNEWVDTWPGGWQLTAETTVESAPPDATEVAPGVYRLEDVHRVYAVPSASTDRIHQVTVNARTGAMRCDGPDCHGRTCSHQRRVLKARAGF